ncbi:MAG TPA: hypothetical protein VI365_09790 [Trebonia sp.]
MIRSLIPARIDRLPWSRFHTRMVTALGVAWILDGLETTIASNVGPDLTLKGTTRAPDFEAKASVILDLYQGFYQGQPLGPRDRILSFDAKPSIQARGRVRETKRTRGRRPASRQQPDNPRQTYGATR